MQLRHTPQQTLEHLGKAAKRWLRQLRADERDARARLERAVPNAPRAPTLRDVQHAIARELGFAGWTALKRALETPAPEPGSLEAIVDRFLDSACPDHHVRGVADHARARHTAMRLLEHHPGIARFGFHSAVVCGEIDMVRAALAADPRLASAPSRAHTPERAMGGGSGDLFRELGSKGWEPLLYLCFTRLPLPAANDNAVAIARLLLDHGADPSAWFPAGGSRYTSLVGAIGEGEEERPPHPRRNELVRLLLDAGADPYDSQVTYNLGFNANYLWYLPLIHEHSVRRGRAADWDDPEWTMLDMGDYGSGARWILGHALENNDLALVEWCLAHGANPDSPPPRDPRHPKESLYEQALRLGAHEIAELLARHGAPRTLRPLRPLEAFRAACARKDPTAARELIAAHPDELRSREALFTATEHDFPHGVEMLLELGVSPDIADADGLRPLHVAAYNDAAGAARVLIAHGATIDAVERTYGNTPLGAAEHFRHRAMIDLLVPLSLDVWSLTYLGKIDRLREVLAEDPRRSRVSWEGETPLMWLPPDDESVALEIVKLFLDCGADPTVRNAAGATAADRAAAQEMTRVAEYLRARENGGGA